MKALENIVIDAIKAEIESETPDTVLLDALNRILNTVFAAQGYFK